MYIKKLFKNTQIFVCSFPEKWKSYLIPAVSDGWCVFKNCLTCVKLGFMIPSLIDKDCWNVISPCIACFVLKNFRYFCIYETCEIWHLISCKIPGRTQNHNKIKVDIKVVILGKKKTNKIKNVQFSDLFSFPTETG